MSLFRLSYQGLLSSSCRPRKPPSASQVCIFACKSSYFYYNFAQELIEDLRVPHLVQLPSQPAQLEASLLHPTGDVIHVNALLQTLNFAFAVLNYIRILNPLGCCF